MDAETLVKLPGTVRAQEPEQTWALLEDRLGQFGITRVADLTGLDTIGLPVWTAVRPDSRTLSASQGKGATDILAKISAVMEAIELWHVEQLLPVAARGAARDVAPTCPVAALPLSVPVDARVLEEVVWEWTPASGLISGNPVLVPVDLVRRRVQRPAWSPDLLRVTSTGLACGTVRDEALLHALFEIVERDVLYRDSLTGGRRRRPIAPDTVTDSYARQVIQRLTRADMALEIALVDGPYGLPVAVAYLWSEDLPVVFAGGGCHADPAIALTRAMTEAAQSRLTLIAGTRDDLPSQRASADRVPAFRPAPPTGLADWTWAVNRFAPAVGGFTARVTDTAHRIRHVTGHEPVALDLSGPYSPVHAVQVLCPGARSRITRSMPR